MGALSDLLRYADKPANPAKTANLTAAAAGNSQHLQDSQGGEPEIRARLLVLAEGEGVDPAHVHRLHADDVTACDGLSDETLRAYLRALDVSARMDAGLVPLEWGEPVARSCEACGPVLLLAGCPDVVKACPWCFRRKAGNAIPRPPVACCNCRHYQPDPLNPAAGVAACGVGTGRMRGLAVLHD